jgi:hypothetical protein
MNPARTHSAPKKCGIAAENNGLNSVLSALLNIFELHKKRDENRTK